MYTRNVRMRIGVGPSAVIMTVYLAGGVVAKIGGSKLHEVLSMEDADGVAVLGSVRVRDRMCSLLIWSKSQFTV